jgi:hypothetical protein
MNTEYRSHFLKAMRSHGPRRLSAEARSALVISAATLAALLSIAIFAAAIAP